MSNHFTEGFFLLTLSISFLKISQNFLKIWNVITEYFKIFFVSCIQDFFKSFLRDSSRSSLRGPSRNSLRDSFQDCFIPSGIPLGVPGISQEVFFRFLQKFFKSLLEFLQILPEIPSEIPQKLKDSVFLGFKIEIWARLFMIIQNKLLKEFLAKDLLCELFNTMLKEFLEKGCPVKITLKKPKHIALISLRNTWVNFIKKKSIKRTPERIP